MKLAYKLLLVIIIVSVISIGVLSYIIATITKNSVSQSIESSQSQLARQTMDKVDRLLNERYNNVQTITGDSVIVNFLTNIDQGKTVTSGTENISSGFIKRVQDLTIVTGPWDDIDVISRDGVVRYSLNIQNDMQNLNANPLHKKLLEEALNGNTVYSDAVLDEETNKPTILFVSPVRNDIGSSQKVVGVVMMHLSWPVISEVLGSITGPTIDLYNHQGVEISNNDNLSVIFKEKSNDLSVKAALQGKDVSAVTINKEKIDTVSSSVFERGFSAYKGNNWVLLLYQPTSIAFEPAAKAARIINLVVVPIFLVTDIIILFFVLRLLYPIVLLTETIQKIAGGDFTKRVPVSSRDEIGQLASSFNNMAAKLQELYQGLEEKVKEKTSELALKVIELGQEKTKDEAILESIGDGMIVYAFNGTVLLMNQTAQQMLNLQVGTYHNKSAFELFQLKQLDGTLVLQEKRPLSIALKTGKKISETFIVSGENEKPLTITITATPVIEQTEIIGTVEILRDVTKEKEVDRMKTEFISLASHQLRTPLSAIKWFSEMLVGGDAGKLTDEQKEFAQNISDSTERMIELVNSLLNISRIESGRILIDPKPTDLKDLIQGIVKELQVKITERKQTLIISVHQDLPKINLDPKLIRQVYMNLLTNAIKYTQKGGEISVFISKKDEEVISQVTDNGYGIPKAEQPKLFQKFFRAENVVKIETDGTGLGLYLIKAIIDSSKGKIWFTSEEGKGTTFWFSLPMSGMEAKKGEVTLDQ